MKFRLIPLCMMFVLIATFVPGVMAQDTTICGNLLADDYTTLKTALTNTGAAGSGAFTLDATVDIEADDPLQAAKVDVKADGKFNGITPMSIVDMAAMSDNPVAAIQSITAGLKGFTGELNLTISGLPASAPVSADGKPAVINLLMVNGIGYFDFSKLPSTITTGLAAYKIPNGWAGLDLIDVLTNIGPALGSNMSSGTTSTSTADLQKVEVLIAKHLKYTRDGATFTGDVDLVGLFNDPEFKTMANIKSLSAAETAAIESLKDVTFEVVFTLEGDKLSELQLIIDVPESTATAINATNGNSSSSGSKAPKSGHVNIDFKYSGLGEPQTITAPAGAPVAKFLEFARIVNDVYQKLIKDLTSG